MPRPAISPAYARHLQAQKDWMFWSQIRARIMKKKKHVNEIFDQEIEIDVIIGEILEELNKILTKGLI